MTKCTECQKYLGGYGCQDQDHHASFPDEEANCDVFVAKSQVVRTFESGATRDMGVGKSKSKQSASRTEKFSNPKDSLGIKKAPLHCIPCGPLFELGLAMLEGARKYGSHNYRVVGVRASVYYDAALRHLGAYWEGEEIDPDSGLPHIVKAIACLVVLRDSQLMGNCKDDRPVRYPDGLDFNRLNEQAYSVIQKYPDCKEPFCHLKRRGE